MHHKEDQYQSNVKQTPSLNQYQRCRGCWPPTNTQITFAWVSSMNSIIWNHEVCSCLLKKMRKPWKLVENSENACQKGNDSKEFVKNLDLMPRYMRMKFENWELFWWKRFGRLESKLVRSQRKEKKDQIRRKVCTEVVNVGVRSGRGIVTALGPWLHSALFCIQIKKFRLSF